jgi:hypothetical protein
MRFSSYHGPPHVCHKRTSIVSPQAARLERAVAAATAKHSTFSWPEEVAFFRLKAYKHPDIER